MKIKDLTFQGELKPILQRVSEKKLVLDCHRPLPSSAWNRLREQLALEWTFHSNSIEGNTLSLSETRIVIEDGLTIGGKTLKEHFEVTNHHKAIDYLAELASSKESFRPVDLLKLHELVMKNVDDQFAGRLRNGMVRIIGANFTPPAPNALSELLDECFEYIHSNPQDLNVLELATVFHHRLVWIHPFFDGNGRTSRLAMNLLLMRSGYPPAVILKNDRQKYFNALNAANKGNYRKICLLLLQAAERSLNIFLNVLPDYCQEYRPVSDIAEEEGVPYSGGYLSLLARNGLINAHKEGRNWVTSRKAVLDYSKQS